MRGSVERPISRAHAYYGAHAGAGEDPGPRVCVCCVRLCVYSVHSPNKPPIVICVLLLLLISTLRGSFLQI